MTPRLLIVILLVAAAGGGLWMLLDPGTTNAPGGGIVEEAPADVPEHGATLEGDQRTTPQPGASNSPASETPPPRPGSREALAAQEARAAKEVPAPLEKVLAKVRVLLPDGRPAIGTHVMLRSRDGTTVFEGTVSGATFILDVPPGRYELIARGP
ncbi:MAG: carboxypeptidase regulatory-like domain-containing protein, partial [bacterium]|nr:carboxypeptidase regulatory-like domain-containing protein [bacterium]